MHNPITTCPRSIDMFDGKGLITDGNPLCFIPVPQYTGAPPPGYGCILDRNRRNFEKSYNLRCKITRSANVQPFGRCSRPVGFAMIILLSYSSTW